MRRCVLAGLVVCASCHGGASGRVGAGGSIDAPEAADAPLGDAYAMSDGGITVASHATSGTRLKIRWFQTADGLRFEDDDDGSLFFDSLRGEDCRVISWADGNAYCTPQVTTGPDDLVFSDPTCTTVIGSVDGPTPYFAQYAPACTSTVVGPIQHLYRTGPALPANTAEWMFTLQPTGGYQCSCVSGTAPGCPVPPQAVGYGIAGEVDASSLVRVTRAAEGSGRLEAYFNHGADGMTAPISSAYDTMLATDCWLGMTCTPAPFAVVGQPATSATCPAPTLDAAVPAGCSPPAYALEDSGIGTSAVFSVGAVDTGCRFISGETAYHLGSQVSPAMLTFGYETSPMHRLARIALTSGTVDYHEAGAYDTAKGVECDFVADASGIHCLPGGHGQLVSLYTDGTCTSSVLLYEDSTNGGVLPAYTSLSFNGQLATYAIAPAEHAGMLYYKTDTNCEVWWYDYPPLDKWHDVTVVPSSEFEPATLVVDP